MKAYIDGDTDLPTLCGTGTAWESYYREEWIDALHDAVFEWAVEYKNREKEIWQESDASWFIEAIRK